MGLLDAQVLEKLKDTLFDRSQHLSRHALPP
jgi:hypothetical protein